MAYNLTIPIGVGQTDPYGRCKPSALLTMLQEAAMADCRAQGIDSPDLHRLCGGQWILVRLSYELTQPLVRDQEVLVTTAHRGLSRGLIYRDATLTVEGACVGRAVSAWVVGSVQTRKMLWPGELPPALTQKAPPGPQLKKLRLPAALTPVYTHLARYSDLDENGHVNNARYADFCCNALDPADLERHWVSALELNYSVECRGGQSVALAVGGDGNTRYLCGSLENSPCFEAKLELKDEPETAALHRAESL